jgi:alkanesulfonate monooxygenase SsuD/methylene tetrahydromethanopterin reductase-like flavin-dependent oxidoreductase (luciferase family)
VAERFHFRGAYLDETIRLWRHLWSGSTQPFRGRFHDTVDFAFGPLPAQGDKLPIVVGGRSDAAVARAGTLGDGYHSSAIGPDAYRPRAEKALEAAHRAGRTISLSARVQVRLGEAGRGAFYAMRGTPEQVAAEVRAWAGVGVTHLALAFGKTAPDDVARAAESFAREVVPLV